MLTKKPVICAIIIGLGVLVIILGSTRRVQLEPNPVETLFSVKQETRVDAGFGPIWTISLVVSRENFSEDNLTRIFRFFSNKHPDKEEKLHIAVYTSLENWEKEQEQFPFDFSLPGGQVPFDPQDRRILCDAMFFREGNGDFAPGGDNEWYWFSPDLNSPNETKTVVLKGSVGTKTPSG